MASLPIEPEEAEWLIDRSAELIAAAGWRGYVSAPLVLPDESSFPERWTADARGLRRLALRLLAYAGLDDLDVSIEVFEGERKVELDGHGIERVVGHEGAAAWFAGIEDGVCSFGCEVDQLDDPIGVVGAMAHEVAHAFRRHRGIEVDDRDLEERLTDLTTVYLGFGVLTANAALRHRSFANDGLLLTGHRWTRNQLGYLPAAAMCFALALWQLVRGDDPKDRKRIRKVLEPNQSAWFASALGWLHERKAELAFMRELPVRERWPEPLAVGDVQLNEEEADEDEPEGEPDEGEDTRVEEQEAVPGMVFRVRGRRAWGQGKLGWVAAGIGILAAMIGQTVELMLGAVAVVGSALIYGLQPIAYCSDPACDRSLKLDERVCPGCRRRIAGEIPHRKYRLDAEERVLAGQPLPLDWD